MLRHPGMVRPLRGAGRGGVRNPRRVPPRSRAGGRGSRATARGEGMAGTQGQRGTCSPWEVDGEGPQDTAEEEPGGKGPCPPQGRGTDGCRGQQRAPEQDASGKTIGNFSFVPSSASPVAPPTPPVARAPPPGESATGPPLRSASTLPPMATPMPHLAASPSPTDVALFPTTPGIAEGKGKGGNKPAAHRPEEHLVPPRGLFAHSTAL